MDTLPYVGFGLGLRPEHYDAVLTNLGSGLVDWFELITDDFLIEGGRPWYYLDRISERYPVAMHGVSLSIGSSDPIDYDYLAELKKLADRVQPVWISDHFCWGGIHGMQLHDLLPLPYTEEAVAYLVARITTVQEILERPLVLENIASYLRYQSGAMSEWDFIRSISEASGCKILLDINNIYVNSVNHCFDPQEYLAGIPIEKVQQFHLAGHRNCGSHIVDTHDHAVSPAVWDLYRQAVARFGAVSTIIERDDHIPELRVLLAELQQARSIAEEQGMLAEPVSS